MLRVNRLDSREFLIENKKKLLLVGSIASAYETVPVTMNLDGTFTAVRPRDHEIEEMINKQVQLLKDELVPLVEYIRDELFDSCSINSQELVVNRDYNVLALCDLSSEKVVLEIKTNDYPAEKYKEQLYFEACGRKCYHLNMEWVVHPEETIRETIKFNVSRVYVEEGEAPVRGWSEERREQKRKEKEQAIAKILSDQNIELLSFNKITEPIEVKCLVCGNEWFEKYNRIVKNSEICKMCHPKEAIKSKPKRKYETPEKRLKAQEEKYAKRIDELSKGLITVENYTGSKDNVVAHCKVCGYQWSIRADHLVSRCYCKMCKN